jgi:hypothetical protein
MPTEVLLQDRDHFVDQLLLWGIDVDVFAVDVDMCLDWESVDVDVMIH